MQTPLSERTVQEEIRNAESGTGNKNQVFTPNSAIRIPYCPSRVFPFHERFQGIILRKAKGVVSPSGSEVAVLGPLPELAAVRAAGEHRLVLLGLVSEDRLLLAFQHFRRERHGHFDLVRLP